MFESLFNISKINQIVPHFRVPNKYHEVQTTNELLSDLRALRKILKILYVHFWCLNMEVRACDLLEVV